MLLGLYLLLALVSGHVSGRVRRQSSQTPASTKRNIVFIVADDMGWNDIGYNNPDVKTPVLDDLASNGIILDHAYMQAECSPSRAAIMTGLYPFRIGLPDGVVLPGEQLCLAPGQKLLPQILREQGYATHMVGKWHLGHCNWNCTPTERGFDSFYGFYNAAENYYTKVFMGANDFRDDKVTIHDETYSTFLHSQRAVQIIADHDQTKPLFLYLPFQAVHSPVQVPQQYTDLHPNTGLETRRKFKGMLSVLDEAIGNVTKALEANNMLKDTLIVFTSDNGGMPSISGNNLPFRGAKTALYEGGTRVPSFIYGNGLRKTRITFEGLFHAVDWFPTILEAAGMEMSTATIDGISQWSALRNQNTFSPRNEIVYNVNITGFSAIRVGRYKLIEGYPGPLRDWYNYTVDFRPDLVPIDGNDGLVFFPLFVEDEQNNPEVFTGVQLFDLTLDPEERNDISADNPDVVSFLAEKLAVYRDQTIPRQPIVFHPNSNPSYYNGYWTPGFC